MSKWQNWMSGYMAADQSYLVHISQNASDNKYFVGTFTGRFKETLYFRDQFDNEFSLNVGDYICGDTCSIEFIPISEINDWAFDKDNKGKSNSTEMYIGVIDSVNRKDHNEILCNIKASHKLNEVSCNKRFACNCTSAYTDEIVGSIMKGNEVLVKLREGESGNMSLVSMQETGRQP